MKKESHVGLEQQGKVEDFCVNYIPLILLNDERYMCRAALTQHLGFSLAVSHM